MAFVILVFFTLFQSDQVYLYMSVSRRRLSEQVLRTRVFSFVSFIFSRLKFFADLALATLVTQKSDLPPPKKNITKNKTSTVAMLLQQTIR